MTTDNRTNEPSIEAAARIIYDHSAVSDEGNVCQCGHETGHDLAFHQAERLQAAGHLMAAVDAVSASPPSNVLDEHNDTQERESQSEDHPATLSRAVLPSSTVDEDALAEVIREAIHDDHLRVTFGVPVNVPKYVVVARAVAEWLKEQGR